MAEDRSLDDFADTDADAGDVSDSADTSDADDAPDSTDADPAVATSTWHADGAACDRCGERVERRWREADAYVCADCASW
ncbi:MULTISPECIES: hypothetical protein [Halorubrum]|jgi:hypothetical protein|uniref:DUF7573 domain-containing protein n=1 Tax=Halorubrum tropicale TaxID=1765655 RepID=A0A0M9AU53_9EURY|nr:MULTISPECIES: hypothetical protein [Halorubrum]KOX97875.1 hypothetical protein AMR74_02955 [Halorubrum tropicale]RLM50418.1 hypothetical protein DVK06_09240 [Halorubrum sp. Atlit-28R]TKX43004.1 hypothetical protein EXE50_11960 [Halorubrum sp. ARQ200]TKX50504.1 hypothetical protein EXE49_05365 [Halorubrum sp. ASP121]TKX62307.1 hypothetical protein EXE48_06475 [Halorubrum sp. ASP1]